MSLQNNFEGTDVCAHCGDPIAGESTVQLGRTFCCEGCSLVYGLLHQEGMCAYYDLNKTPGISLKTPRRKDQFAFLEDPKIETALIDFKDQRKTVVVFHLPAMHCSSCLWLLENLRRLHPGIEGTQVNFSRKEIRVVFSHQKLSLRQLAELLQSIGYEPYISLNQLQTKKAPANKKMIVQLGIAGFCFANIMLMSFPEYLGITKEGNSWMQQENKLLEWVFRYFNLVLSLPVVFYSASTFFLNGWKSIKQRYLNIDAPIALAIAVTFIRSVYEVFSGVGSGYFDSMTGIVFFMLVGRVLQNRTYQQLSFDRDYTSYFPIAVTRLASNSKSEDRSCVETPVSLPEIKLNDTLLIHHGELIPADGILTRGKAVVDYSFVTGESAPVVKEMGEIIYAGGRQTGGNIELLVIREVTQSYLTRLWNQDQQHYTQKSKSSFVEPLSKYFTWVVFAIALVTAFYWQWMDSARVWNAATAVLIIACPCALLLCHTFTNGNMLRRFSQRGFYLRNDHTLESLAHIDWVVFDKTGTLTDGNLFQTSYEGEPLREDLKMKIAALARQSTHPLSKAIVKFLQIPHPAIIQTFREEPGAGIEGMVHGDLIALGTKSFVTAFVNGGAEKREPDFSTMAVNAKRNELTKNNEDNTSEKSSRTELEGYQADAEAGMVYVSLEGNLIGRFVFSQSFRKEVPELLQSLSKEVKLTVLSGDREVEKKALQKWMGPNAALLFRQKPEDKLQYIKALRKSGYRVMMIGDGLNDAGALKEANVGIALSDQTAQFTPASDAILEAASLPSIQQFIKEAKWARKIILAAFAVSIVYNLIGLWFAVQGLLNPLVAAILMPASSLTILLITYGSTELLTRRNRMLLRSNQKNTKERQVKIDQHQ